MRKQKRQTKVLKKQIKTMRPDYNREDSNLHAGHLKLNDERGLINSIHFEISVKY